MVGSSAHFGWIAQSYSPASWTQPAHCGDADRLPLQQDVLLKPAQSSTVAESMTMYLCSKVILKGTWYKFKNCSEFFCLTKCNFLLTGLIIHPVIPRLPWEAAPLLSMPVWTVAATFNTNRRGKTTWNLRFSFYQYFHLYDCWCYKGVS